MLIMRAIIAAAGRRLVLIDSNIIPTMTSNTTPSGIASATSSFDIHLPWRAFDKNGGTYWMSASDFWPTGGFIGYEFTSPKIIQKYSLRIWADGVDYWPSAWLFQAWDGSSWVTLDTQSGVTWSFGGQTRSYTISNSTAYSRYRLWLSSTGSGRSRAILSEVEMMEAVWQ